MSLDLRCRSCNGTGKAWSPPFASGRSKPDPCDTCNGTGKLDLDTTLLDIARRHGTRVAAEWGHVSRKRVVKLRQVHDAYTRGRGHPTVEEMAAAQPSNTCPCVRCIDWRLIEARSTSQTIAVLTPLLEAAPEWTAAANCRGVDPDRFFPARGESHEPAAAICAACVVQDDCLQYALDTRQKHGVWGGVSERARRRMRKDRKTNDSEVA